MVVSLYAGILGIFYVALSAFVIKGRFKHQLSLGDGNVLDMEKRVRTHGNFIEYVPIALILLFLAEKEGFSEVFIHILGGGLVFGRFLHPVGMLTKEGPSIYRAGGTILTFLVILIASALCLKAYLT